jgi:uncharacterized membrane protein YoaK (UPF0700 family)
MINLLPRWVWSGAWALAFIAGIVNVVGFLGFEHQGITHLSGSTSLFGAALGHFDMFACIKLFGGIFAFVLGTAISGFLIEDSALKIGGHYSVVLLLESLLLACAVPCMQHNSLFGYYCAACACGLQNAMATTYSGSVVRTTHVSGMFTDLGIAIGHVLRGRRVDARRLRLCVIVISGFIFGGFVGTLLFNKINYAALYFPALLTGVTAIAYQLLSLRNKRLSFRS